MTFGNFWRGGGRERYGSERDHERDRERWRDSNEQRRGAWDRDDDETGGRDYGGREGRYGSSDWESGDNYGDRSRGYSGSSGYGSGGGYGAGGYGGGRQGYGGERYRGQNEGYGSQSGRGWGSEERERDYFGSQSGG